jgi:NMD protein affecting ribosome stability and mRNA decay|tara:strand:- start:551 stop:889 length:339 start_codon:yes stop_codon:yes gene_type:complete
MAYALGKFAKGLCDRCAFEYKLSELREEWNGAKVCPDCYEPKHPQLEPLTATADPEALYRPRPNNDHEEGEGFVVVVQSNIFRPDYLNTSTLPTNFTVSEMTANVGEVTIVT